MTSQEAWLIGDEVQQLLSSLDQRRRALLKKALAGDPIARLWLAPWKVMERPDPWQQDALSQLITRNDDVMMLCSRGAGKTETLAAAGVVEAANGGFMMVLARADRQAKRVIRRARPYVERLTRRGIMPPLIRDTEHELEFDNGGRILALPCSGDTIVGEHGVTILGIDEAARIKDSFYAVVTPMLAVSKEVTGIDPRLVLLSTPFGERGFFWEEWKGERRQGWKRHRYPWTMCPRLTPQFIENERASHGDQWIHQEYDCVFTPTAQGLFDVSRLEQCEIPEEEDISDIPTILDLEDLDLSEDIEGGW